VKPTSHKFTAPDGAELAWHELGEGKAVVLLHGLFSNAETNWIKFGHAAQIAGRGFRVIVPDLRAHGQSAAPHDPASYPPDVLVRDAQALIAHLGLEEFDLGGFSLGARTAAAMMIEGVRPRRAVLAGMGLEGLSDWDRRRDFFITAIDRRDEVSHGDRHWLAVQFMKTMKIDPQAARLLLASPTHLDPARLGDRQRDPRLWRQRRTMTTTAPPKRWRRRFPAPAIAEVPGSSHELRTSRSSARLSPIFSPLDHAPSGAQIISKSTTKPEDAFMRATVSDSPFHPVAEAAVA
jgi:pimeloyl-ACP methyl ester carboxylesterase